MSSELQVATRKGLFTVTREAGEWGVRGASFLADPVLICMEDPRNGWRYAALGHGHFGVKLHRSKNGGKSWDELSAPAYPEPPEGTADVCPQRRIPIPWRTEQIWAMAAGGVDEPGRLWCGTVPGGLFRSDDDGATWVLMRSLWDMPQRHEWFGGGLDYPGIHSICVDPRNARRVFVGISCGGVWLTEDGGESWKCRADGMIAAYMPPERQGDPNIQDPHMLVMCRAQPDCMWVQHHNGVFKTVDGGRQWDAVKGIEPSDFGFAVAVHPDDPGTAWFVPAIKDELRIPVDGKVVVTRTRDGGRSFEILRGGLPQAFAYDIVFRHSMDISDDGETLAFGSTTGSLWVSDDGGESWVTVSHHLPPVYCVRFASGA